MSSSSAASMPRAVVFDMDGTLTHAGAIDFARMQERCGVPAGTDILTHVNAQADGVREALHAIVVEEEVAGLARTRLRHDCVHTLRTLQAAGVRTAVLTRNNADIMNAVLRMHAITDAFDALVSREFTPTKPAPDPILHLARSFECAPQEMIMVGDAIDDMQSGRSAGARTVLIGEPSCKYFQEALPLADHVIHDLSAVLSIVGVASST